MYGKIIIGLDDREQSRDAARLGRALAELMDARLILATALPYGEAQIGREGARQFLRKDSEARFGAVRSLLGSAEFETRAVGGSGPARALHELAESEGADLIVLGSTHRGRVGRVLPGSVGERLLSAGPCAVAVAPKGYARRESQIRRIAVGYDGADESKAALRVAEEIAGREGAHLRLVTVFEAPGAIDSYQGLLGDRAREFERRLDEGLQSLSAGVSADGRLVDAFDRDRNVSDDAAALIEEVASDTDLLVIGSRAYGPLRRVLLGGVSAKVMRNAACPVLVVPRAAVTQSGVAAEVAADHAA